MLLTLILSLWLLVLKSSSLLLSHGHFLLRLDSLTSFLGLFSCDDVFPVDTLLLLLLRLLNSLNRESLIKGTGVDLVSVKFTSHLLSDLLIGRRQLVRVAMGHPIDNHLVQILDSRVKRVLRLQGFDCFTVFLLAKVHLVYELRGCFPLLLSSLNKRWKRVLPEILSSWKSSQIQQGLPIFNVRVKSH